MSEEAHADSCPGGDCILVAQKCTRCLRFARPADRKISIEDVRRLCDRTGAGLLECKEALKIYGAADAAERYLKCKGLAAVAKCDRFEPSRR